MTFIEYVLKILLPNLVTNQWRLQKFCLGGSLKNFNKKNLNISNYQPKKNLIHEVLQFSSTSFQILNCYMIVHYEYLLSMWVSMRL